MKRALLGPVIAARPDLGVAADPQTTGQDHALLVGGVAMRRQAGTRRQAQQIGLKLLVTVQQLHLDTRGEDLPVARVCGNGEVRGVGIGHAFEQATLDGFGLARRDVDGRFSLILARET